MLINVSAVLLIIVQYEARFAVV